MRPAGGGSDALGNMNTRAVRDGDYYILDGSKMFASMANETDVGHALHALAGFLAAEQIPSLALPRLASGVGKLSWDVVQPLIERHLGPVEIPVYVYASYHAGQAAREV